jgi:predicted amidohydrolase YtcJ
MKLRAGAVSAALVVCAMAGPALADTLIDNVDGITLDAAGHVERLAGLIVGNDGRIVQVLHQGDKPARVDYRVDGKGRVMMPGLVDGHARIMDIGFATLTLDLSPAKSLEEALGRIAAYAAAHPDRPWLLGRGWDARAWGRLPTAADLDSAIKDRPVWLASADGHSGWANSAALAAAGITATTRDPAGGRIVRAAGKATGVLTETAMALIEKAVPAPRPEDRDLAFAAAQDILLKRGITTVTDVGTTIEDWQSLRRAGDLGRLQVRVIGYAAGTEAMTLIGGPGPTPWLYDDRLRLNGVALVLDGAAATGGAWMKGNAAGGMAGRLNPTQLRNLMSRAGIDRFQVAIEAHGDGAVGAALDAIGELAQTYKGERRWRIEAIEAADPADSARFGPDIAAALLPASGPAKSLAGTNVKLASGSGAPGPLAEPFAAITAAITRADGQNITREQALAAWTTGAAWAGYADAKVGRLAPGLRADFILIDRDPTMAPAGDLAATRVMETWIGGRKVFGQ